MWATVILACSVIIFRTNVSTEVGRLKLNAILAYTRNNSVSTTGGSLEVDAARVPTYYYYKIEIGRWKIFVK